MDTDHLIKSPTVNLGAIFTPIDEAVAEIQRRRRDLPLVKKVQEYLSGDIPEHFTYSKPIFYLSRHIATPNYETLRFIELTQNYDLPRVIGIDPKDKFFSGNPLKRALGKMPVTKGTARNGDEIIEHFTIVDFAKADGHSLDSIMMKSGVSLTTFHEQLLREIYPTHLMIRNESGWVERCGRTDLINQYKKMFALLCVFGIMFESYPPAEYDLVANVVVPAIDEVTSVLGCKPLIVEHISPELELSRNWNAYPSVLYRFLHDSFTNHR